METKDLTDRELLAETAFALAFARTQLASAWAKIDTCWPVSDIVTEYRQTTLSRITAAIDAATERMQAPVDSIAKEEK